MNRRMTFALTASLVAVVAVVALLWAFNIVAAAAPQAPQAAQQAAAAPVLPTINYQGRLTDPTGANVSDGLYSMTFGLYDTGTGGTPLWTQTSSVLVRDGLFNVELGSPTNPLSADLFPGGTRWLGIQVDPDPDEMLPRQLLTSVPYAFRAETLRVGGLVSGTTPGPIYTFANNGTGPALEIDGDAHIDGDVTWYTRTGYISVSPAAFESYDESFQYVKKGRSLHATSGANFYAPLQLPHGSTVVSMTFHYLDNDATGAITTTLKRGPVDGTASQHSDMAVAASPAAAAVGYDSATDDTIDDPVVDNQNYIYWLYTRFDGALTDAQRVMAVVIAYQYTEPY